jgi:beta-glucosidase
LTTDSPVTNGFQVGVDLQNTGSVDGAEVVQVYLGLPTGLGEPPKRLVGRGKVKLASGAQQHVTITVDANDSSHPLSYWGTTTNGWVVANGDYTMYVGNSSANLTPAGTFHVGP